MKINEGPEKNKKELKSVSKNKKLRVKQNFQVRLEFTDKVIMMDFSFN